VVLVAAEGPGPIDRLRRGSNSDQSALGYGTLDTAGDGSMQLPAGASAPLTRMQGDNIALVKDEAVEAALNDLKSDFATFLQQQKTFLNSFQGTMKDINKLLDHVADMARQTVQSQHGGGHSGAGGSALAGMTTASNIHHAFGSALNAAETSLHMAPGVSPTHGSGPAPQGASGGGVLTLPLPGAGPTSPLPTLPGIVPPQTTPTGSQPPGGGAPPAPGGGSQTGPGQSTVLPPLPGPGAVPGSGLIGKITGKGAMQSVSEGVGFVRKGYSEYLKQRGENYDYQHELGGANSNQFDVRAAEKGFRFSHLGESSEVDNQLYEGALALGYRDDHRGVGGFIGGLVGTRFGHNIGTGVDGQYSATQVANSGYHLRQSSGVGTDEYYNAVNTMSQNAGASLGQVVAGLKDVTEAAHKFGVNAVLVRQKLNDTFTDFTHGGLGAGAMPLAEAAVTSITAGGKTLEGVGFQLGDSMQYRAAATGGLNQTQFQVLAAQSPGEAAKLTDNLTGRTLDAILGQDVVAWIKSELSQYPDVKNNESMKNKVATDAKARFASKFPSMQALAASVANLLPYTGVDENNVWSIIVNYYAGNTVGAAAKEIAAKSAPTKGTFDSHGRSFLNKHTFFFGQGASSDSEKAYSALTKTGNTGKGTVNDGWLKGQRSPVIESLLKDVGSDQKVAVDTRNGKKVMSLADALKYYPAEVAAGTVMMVGGDHADQTVKQITGLADGTKSTQDEAAKESVSKTAAASTSKDPAFKPSSSSSSSTSGSGNQKVTIGLSPQAMQLLSIIPNTAAAQTGTPQTPSTSPGQS
jgi:hypothetical protein